MLIYGMANLNIKLIHIMDTKELLNIYNKLSNEDLINLFEMSSERIFDGMILKPMVTKK